jgi:hypothetical protein
VRRIAGDPIRPVDDWPVDDWGKLLGDTPPFRLDVSSVEAPLRLQQSHGCADGGGADQAALRTPASNRHCLESVFALIPLAAKLAKPSPIIISVAGSGTAAAFNCVAVPRYTYELGS